MFGFTVVPEIWFGAEVAGLGDRGRSLSSRQLLVEDHQIIALDQNRVAVGGMEEQYSPHQADTVGALPHTLPSYSRHCEPTMRHSRSTNFQQALASNADAGPHWSSVASDPNDPKALVRRAETLRRAWRPPVPDRVAFLEDRCRGRHILDIGCVAHDVRRMSADTWLHARLAKVAASCLGVDVLADGVNEMTALGYDAVLHDLRSGLGPVAERAPFDVIVAGELIEHLEVLDMLFTTAASALADGGEMIITTPNPYAPHRVRAAQLGIVWENVDHVVYAFPSGMAELCDRHGLVLSEAAVTVERGPRGLVPYLKSVKRQLTGRQWATVGYATFGKPRVRRVDFGPLGRALRSMTLPGHRFTGETFVYVVRKPST